MASFLLLPFISWFIMRFCTQPRPNISDVVEMPSDRAKPLIFNARLENSNISLEDFYFLDV